ncbi:MAG TPA: HPr family phosphocarrier protein [Planctomycetes bacterium]|nr:HPr family phosphocarrier protein [Planctomycetota bacterium]
MIEKVVRLANKYGLHMRPAQGLMQIALQQQCGIYIENNGTRADAKRIIELISLAAEGGQEVKVICEGDGEQESLEAIVQHIEQMPEIYDEERI